jgi:dUTP pyrophosphatase
VDSDFRGEIVIALINLSQSYKFISRGERIAQLVIAPVTRVDVNEVKVEELGTTVRGSGGFGSTGTGVGISLPCTERAAKEFKP